MQDKPPPRVFLDITLSRMLINIFSFFIPTFSLSVELIYGYQISRQAMKAKSFFAQFVFHVTH